MKRFAQVGVAVIGGGPAGVSAAIWLHQLRVPVVLIEAASALGGLQRCSPYLNHWVPGVHGKRGHDVAQNFHDHAVAVGCAISLDSRVERISRRNEGFSLHLADGRLWRTRFVVIATGVVPRTGGLLPTEKIGIGPGEPMERMALSGQRVAILGGGDNAFSQAHRALLRGAASVRLFTRSSPRAHPAVMALIPADCVCIGPFTAEQPTMTVNGEPFDVFGVQFGFCTAPIPGLRLRHLNGHIAVDNLGETSVSGVYACGDVTNFWHPCVATAAAHGVQVAKSLWRASARLTGSPDR